MWDAYASPLLGRFILVWTITVTIQQEKYGRQMILFLRMHTSIMSN